MPLQRYLFSIVKSQKDTTLQDLQEKFDIRQLARTHITRIKSGTSTRAFRFFALEAKSSRSIAEVLSIMKANLSIS